MFGGRREENCVVVCGNLTAAKKNMVGPSSIVCFFCTSLYAGSCLLLVFLKYFKTIIFFILNFKLIFLYYFEILILKIKKIILKNNINE
jgi:hypothetical protein